jgi:hypothetical protein
MEQRKKIYLGGLSKDSNWKHRLISLLRVIRADYTISSDDFLNKIEEEKIEPHDYYIYAISPLAGNIPTIAEAVNCSIKHPYKTLFLIIMNDECVEFEQDNLHYITLINNRMIKNDAIVFFDMADLIYHILEKRPQSIMS